MTTFPRPVRLLLAVAAVFAVVFLLRLTLFRSRPVPVTVFRVERGEVEETVSNSKAGTVKSRRRATLSPETGGRLVELPAKKGQRVKRGEVLLRLASEDLAAQVTLRERTLQAALAAEREACTAATLASREFDRSKNLANDQVLSASLLDQAAARKDSARAACEAAGARIGEARAALDAARVSLEKMTLRAPFDGVVAEISAEVGEWVTPSPPAIPIPPVLELFDPDALYISVPLDEADVGRVKTGQPVRVTFDAFPGKSFAGSISRVASYVLDRVEQNRTFEIEVELSDAALTRSLSPGSSADVEVVLDTRKSVPRFPRTALIEGTRVLVLDGDQLQTRVVKTGLMNWEWVEVLGGLSEGEAVVVSLDRPEVKAGARATAEPAGKP